MKQLINVKKHDGQVIDLPKAGSWDKTRHLFIKKSLYALNAALAANRPLLVRGEPGTGKSQLARAAAHILKRMFISQVVHARSECQDLQWHFDAVRRLGDAQIIPREQNIDTKKFLHEGKYLSPGPLWWAFDYKNAELHCKTYGIDYMPNKPVLPELKEGKWDEKNGCVVLIDEIDKADIDLPNGLLETLGNGAFSTPYTDKPIGHNPEVNPPLVIITTNEERTLPAAFIRRCLVLNLSLPKKYNKFEKVLVAVGKVQFPDEFKDDENIFQDVAQQLFADRTSARDAGLPVPGQAEYIDILRALSEMTEDDMSLREMLKEIKEFAFVKQQEAYL